MLKVKKKNRSETVHGTTSQNYIIRIIFSFMVEKVEHENNYNDIFYVGGKNVLI